MNNVYQAIIFVVDTHNLVPTESTIIIGLSGGPDSVFLTHFLHDIQQERKLDLVAAHLDHQWRAGSDKDVQFCRELCSGLNIPFVGQKASELKFKPKYEGSKEAQGRALRRYFLEEVRQKYNADCIALAHHEGDQQETFFIRLIRGTTLSGLVGMRPKSNHYIRPLLETNKEAILEYLDQHSIGYLTDPTNALDLYLRNRIRSKVLPALRECDKRFDANFLNTIHSLRETEYYLKNLTQLLFDTICIQDKGIVGINTVLLFEQPEYMQFRILIHWFIKENVPFISTNALLKEIKRFLLNKKSREHQLYETWALIKKNDAVYINKD
jgi:tRNA(Ile)-lysidine synthase